MENMRGVPVHDYGGPEVRRFEDAPRPTPGFVELLIRDHAASVNPIDWKVRAGYMKDYIPLPLPFIPGWDVSGVVKSVGSGVSKFKKGDEVYARPDVSAHGYGAYAQYVVAKEAETALKPKSIDHVHAATIPVGAVTAWRALNHHAGDVGSRVPAVFCCSMACRGNILVDHCRSLAGFSHPVHTHRHPADQQAIAEPHAGQTISGNGAATRPLGQIARRERLAQCCGAAFVSVPVDFCEVSMRL